MKHYSLLLTVVLSLLISEVSVSAAQGKVAEFTPITYSSVYMELDEPTDDVRIYARLRAFPKDSNEVQLPLDDSFKVDVAAIAEQPVSFEQLQGKVVLKPKFKLKPNTRTLVALTYHKHFRKGTLKQDGLFLSSEENWLPIVEKKVPFTSDLHIKIHPAWRVFAPRDTVKTHFQANKQVYDLSLLETTSLPPLLAGRYRVRNFSGAKFLEPHRFNLTLPETLPLKADKNKVYTIVPSLKGARTLEYATEQWTFLTSPIGVVDLKNWLGIANSQNSVVFTPEQSSTALPLLRPAPYETSNPTSLLSPLPLPSYLNKPEALLTTPTPQVSAKPQGVQSTAPVSQALPVPIAITKQLPPKFWTQEVMKEALQAARLKKLLPSNYLDYLSLEHQERFREGWQQHAEMDDLFRYYFEEVKLIPYQKGYLLSGKVFSNIDLPLTLTIQMGAELKRMSFDNEYKNNTLFEVYLDQKPERIYLIPQDNVPSFADLKPSIEAVMRSTSLGLVVPDETSRYDELVTSLQKRCPKIRFQRYTESEAIKLLPTQSLILLGQAEEFKVLNEWADQIPYRLQKAFFWDQGKLFSRENMGLSAAFPHPAAPDRYSVLWMMPNPLQPLDLSFLDSEMTAVLFRKQGIISSKSLGSNFPVAEYVFY